MKDFNESSTNNVGVKKRDIWTEVQTFQLLNVWRDNIEDLRSAKRNLHIYQRIADRLLSDYGLKKTTFEIKNKLQNLTKEYRKEKNNSTSGSCSSSWKFFEAIDSVMGIFPSQNSIHIEESVIIPQVVMPKSEPIECLENEPAETFESKPIETLLSNPVETLLNTPGDTLESTHPKSQVIPSVDFSICPKKRKSEDEEINLLIQQQKKFHQACIHHNEKMARLMERQIELQERALQTHNNIFELFNKYLEKN